jgi:integrase
MARTDSSKPPSYRLHKATGQAVVSINRKDHYLGKHGTPESRLRYERLITRWMQGELLAPDTADADPSQITVAELGAQFLKWATEYYRKGGEATSELGNVKRALRALRECYAELPACDFSPLKLQAVRQHLIDDGLARFNVNRYARHIVRIFSWATEREMIPPSVVHGLREVRPLQRGRCAARETDPVGPVDDATVEATLPFLAEPFQTMVRLELILACRPGELVIMRLRDIDRSQATWVYKPRSHKNQHRGKTRIIPIGPKARLLLAPFLTADPDQCLFRSSRGKAISPAFYRNAVYRACKKAGIENPWSPNQLRHSAATRIREQASLDAAQIILGHSSVQTTQIYAEKNLAAALKIAAEVG